jgi:multimeric flavodoxin WrbA
MTILQIVGSHRRNGNTSRALSLLGEELTRLGLSRGQPVQIETVHLGGLRLEPCRGCRLCFNRGERSCPCSDDLLALHERILAADGVVLASPVYVNDVSGTMKTLIDRLAFVCHRPAFGRLNALVLATTGGSPAAHTLGTLKGAWWSWGGRVAAACGLSTGALTPRGEIARRHGRRIARAARRFYEAVRHRRHEQPSFINLMMFCTQQASWRRQDPASFDHRYWAGNGWFEPGCTFFFPHRAPWPRVLAARAVGGLLARLFAG